MCNDLTQNEIVNEKDAGGSARKSGDLAFLMEFFRRFGASADVQEICLRVLDQEAQGDICLQLSSEEADGVVSSPALVAGLELSPTGLPVSVNGIPVSDSGEKAWGYPEIQAPFVLELPGRRLYSRRNWRYVWALRRELEARTADGEGDLAPDGMDAVAELESLNKEQREAVRMMCGRRLSVLTGGPGTGKTYTLARAVLLERQKRARLGNSDSFVIRLAAPTGKAAARMKESLAAAGLENLELLEASTLHRLLGYQSKTPGIFRHQASSPLEVDWLIVDEASMIDLPMMAKLLQALPKDARLTLVGDPNQLASVEPGMVFRELCRYPGIPVTRLVEVRRFQGDNRIGRLAEAVNRQQTAEALEILHGTSPELQFASTEHFALKRLSRWPGLSSLILEKWRSFSHAETPEEALQHLNDCRILCVYRGGDQGVDAMNQLVQNLLGKQAPRPMMITENNSLLNLWNGDVGVVMPGDDKLYIRQEQELHAYPLALLPSAEVAYATTVHKSQGSEFLTVILALPDPPQEADKNCLLSREILYTAITRTREQAFLFGGEAAVRYCCEHPTKRNSGLVLH